MSKGLRIGILGWEPDEHESVGLADTGQERGHEVTLFTLDDVSCHWNGTSVQPRVGIVPVHEFDVIVCRPEIRRHCFQADQERYGLLCSVPGVEVIDDADIYLRAESKLLSLLRLAAADLPIVPSGSCRSLADVSDALATWGRIVLKPSFGYGGTDVERIQSVEEDRELIEDLLARHPTLVCQPYLPHPEGDIRVTVVGDHVPLSFRRIPRGEQWRANVLQGAVAEAVEAPAHLAGVAVRAATTIGLSIAGLDFIPTREGHRIVEINTAPGWFPVPVSHQRRMIHAIYDLAEFRMGGRGGKPVDGRHG